MSKEDKNKANQRRVWEEIFNKGNLAIIPELIAPNWVEHTPLGDIKGPEGFKQGPIIMRNAFPDIHVTIEDILADGDKTVTRFTMTGTFKGEYKGIAPTGRKLIFRGILITQWAGGKEVEAWAAYNMLAFYQQLGIPIPQQ
jgi:predicted ester cyclase